MTQDKTQEETQPEEAEAGGDETRNLQNRIHELDHILAERDERLETQGRQLKALEKNVADKEAEIASLEESAARCGQEIERLNELLAKAVASYRQAVVEANPEIPVELIGGGSIEAIDESLARAKDLVSQVKQGLEAEAARSRIPAGAPARTPPDLSHLSARQKIQYAIGGNH
jgi:multidrug resistance efflux pump